MIADFRPQLADVARTSASNLAFALHCLPEKRRQAALIFYRFCRVVDDIADDLQMDPEHKRQALAAWVTALTTRQHLPHELTEVLRDYQIDPELLIAIVQGCGMDIDPQAFENLEDLRKYCWKVACAVGLVSIRIFGCQKPQSERYALHLGYALQFTNILRDVGEDAALGRIYLPDDLLTKYHVSRESLLAGKPDGSFPALMEELAGIADAEFQAARENLAKEDAGALLPARIMAAIYGKLLKSLRANNFQVFSKRYSIPRWQKLVIALQTLIPVKF